MVSDIARGRQLEREFEKLLNEHGFVTQRARRNVVWVRPKSGAKVWHSSGLIPISQANDLFGVFDILAKNRHAPDNWYCFSVSTRWKYTDRIAELLAWPRGQHDIVCQVRREPRRPFELKLLMPDNTWEDYPIENLVGS